MKTWMLGTALVFAVALSGCSDGNGRSGEPLSGDGGPGQGQGSIPAALIGSWYAGQGYTSAPYDPATGAWGTPSGKGLIYQLAADGSYQKAFQSYESSGGCTTGFTAFEQGIAVASGDQLVLTPSSGHLKYSASCAPSLDSDEPLSDLFQEHFTWSLAASEYDPSEPALHLQAPDGASATFRPL
jgi:hypothetical protein